MRLGYSSMTAGIYQLDEAFQLAHDLALEFVELTYDVCAFLPDAQIARRVRELTRATGVATTVHLPFIDLNIASLVAPARRAAVEETRRALDYACAIDARCGVLHTGTYFIYQPVPRSHALDALYESLAALGPTPVPVALENLGLYVDGLIRTPASLRDLTLKAGLYNCLDFGHAYIEAHRPWRGEAHQDLIGDYIELLGDKIVHLHLCNNDGTNDLHTATSEGDIDYCRYAAFLQAFGGTVCLEVAGGPESVVKSAAHLRSLADTPALETPSLLAGSGKSSLGRQ